MTTLADMFGRTVNASDIHDFILDVVWEHGSVVLKSDDAGFYLRTNARNYPFMSSRVIPAEHRDELLAHLQQFLGDALNARRQLLRNHMDYYRKD